MPATNCQTGPCCCKRTRRPSVTGALHVRCDFRWFTDEPADPAASFTTAPPRTPNEISDAGSGGNAVIDIHSAYKNGEYKSATDFECGAGSFIGGVAMRGTVANLP